MDAPEMFPGEHEVREEALRAGWSLTVGNGFALLFESPYDDGVTLRAYASFFEADVRPAFLLVETLEGDPAPGEARALLGEHGVVCRVGDLMPEDLTVAAQ